MSSISRRNLVMAGAAGLVGACATLIQPPKIAVAQTVSDYEKGGYRYPLSRIEDSSVHAEWEEVASQSASFDPDNYLQLEPAKISYTPAPRIGEVETIEVYQVIHASVFAGSFMFYCHFRAMLNSYGVKVFDEVIDTGVYPLLDDDSVEVTYKELNFLDGRRTCQVLIAATFGVTDFQIEGTLPGTVHYVNQALAVEYYAPYNTGQVFLP